MKRKFLILMMGLILPVGFALGQCGENKPPSCSNNKHAGDADNGTYICSPAHGHTYTLEERPSIWICSGKGTKELFLQVIQRGGTINNMNDPLIGSQLVYAVTLTGECRVILDRDIPQLCGRTGDFDIYLKVYSNVETPGPDCGKRDWHVYWSRFSISEDPLIGKVLPHYNNLFVCPGDSVVLSVDSTVPNQNSAYWYSFPDMYPIGEGYKYVTGIKQLETKQFYVSYIKKEIRGNRIGDDPKKPQDYWVDEDCVYEGVRMPFIVTGLDLDALLPPDPRVEFVCKPSYKTIKIKNPHGYTGVRWYSDAGRTNLIHIGDSYTAFFDESKRLFVEYYNDHGSCETTSATPGIVEIYVAQKDIQEHIAANSWFSYDEKIILDYRDVDGATCESNPAFYLDLTDYEVKNQNVFLGAGGIGADVSLNTHWESNYLVGNESVMLADGESYKGFTADLYSELNPGEKDVCANHVGKPKGSYGKRTYRQMGNFTFIYKVPTGPTTVVEETSTCPANLKRMDVRTIGLAPDTGDVLCPPISIDLLTQVDPDVLSSCQRYGSQNVCPGGRQRIGPSEADVLAWYTGNLPPTIVQLNTRYKWNQKNGLSAYNIANPDVIHEKMDNPMGSYTRYELLITYPDNSVVNYCEIVYKCRNCGETTVEPTLPEINGL